MLDVFKFESYKDFLRQLIHANAGTRGYQAKLAKAAGCQPSYLSQVLTMKADLTLDQSLGLSQALGFDEQEAQYFFTMVSLNRAGTPPARRFLEKQLAKLRRERHRLSDRIAVEKRYAGGLEGFYHSSWTIAAIHLATSLKDRTADAIATDLRLPVAEVVRVLKDLEKFELVRGNGPCWEYVSGATHLPDDSFMTEVNHSNWRQKSVANIPFRQEKDLRYSSVFTLSKEDAEGLREDILKAIEKWRKKIAPSEPEVTMALLCDLFVV